MQVRKLCGLGCLENDRRARRERFPSLFAPILERKKTKFCIEKRSFSDNDSSKIKKTETIPV